MRRDGTSLIFIQYCQSAERRVLVSTDIAIPPAYWNMKTEWVSPNLPKNYGEVENISELLTKKLRHAEDLVKLALQNKDICPLSFLKEKFNSKNDGVVSPKSILPTKNMDVFFHIEDYKDSKRKKVKQCSINVLFSPLGHPSLKIE